MRIAYLQKRDITRNQHRFYQIAVVRTLFGQWAMVREWGRIGQPGTVRENWFNAEGEALSAGLRLQKLKERRGYQTESVEF